MERSKVFLSLVPFVARGESGWWWLSLELMAHIPEASSGRWLSSAKRPNYNLSVARGWESKSVEAQQAEAGEKSSQRPAPMSAEEAARWREQESLRLSRQRVLQQLEASQNPRHRKLLEDTLADLEAKLRK